MMYRIFFACLFIAIFSYCTHTTEVPKISLKRHAYVGYSDSITQNLELTALDSSNVQFVLRVENKYRDTMDSYMGSAFSSDHIHYTHNRKNCAITFELIQTTQTVFINECNCPELTVQPAGLRMTTDSLEMNIQR